MSSETIIGIVLVALATIGLAANLGGTVRRKIAFLSAAVAGDQDLFTDGQQSTIDSSYEAVTRATQNEVEMQGPGVEELSY